MNKNAKAWVKALRSGKYKQGTLALHIGNTYCCLGVACELAATAGVISPGGEEGEGLWRYEEHMTTLPAVVQDWLGIRSGNGDYGRDSLAADNDGGCGFDEIVDIIESEPEGLFA